MVVPADKPSRSVIRGWLESGLLPPQQGYDIDKWSPKARAAAMLINYLIRHSSMRPASAAPVACRTVGLWTTLPSAAVTAEGLMVVLAPGVTVMIHRDVLRACGVPGYDNQETANKTVSRPS